MKKTMLPNLTLQTLIVKKIMIHLKGKIVLFIGLQNIEIIFWQHGKSKLFKLARFFHNLSDQSCCRKDCAVLMCAHKKEVLTQKLFLNCVNLLVDITAKFLFGPQVNLSVK